MRINEAQEHVVIEPGPALTVQEVPELCRTINRLAARGQVQVVLDLSVVRAIDPLGVLGLLGWRQQLLASGGDLAVYRPDPAVADALDLFYVRRQLRITDTLPAAPTDR